MSPLVIVALVSVLLGILLFARVSIGLTLLICGFVGTWLLLGDFMRALGLLQTTPFNLLSTLDFACVPLFLFMGVLGARSGITDPAFDSAYKWLGGVPGGLGMALLVAQILFGAVSGSTVASATLFTKLSVPHMIKAGYEKKLACGLVASVGIIDMLVPPSILMILYGVMTETSIAKLFAAGFLPGFLLAAVYAVWILFIAIKHPEMAPRAELHFSWSEKCRSLLGTWGIMSIILICLGGIYTGFFIPTEAGAFGSFFCIIAMFINRRGSLRVVWESLLESAAVTCMILFICVGASMFGRFIVMSGVTAEFVNFVSGSGLPPLMIISAFLILLFPLGCFLDSVSIMFLTLPFMYPIVLTMGYDPTWFCIVYIVAVELGLLTPPVGLNVFAVKAAAGDLVTLEEVFRGTFPFWSAVIVTLAILVAFPVISLIVPKLLGL